MKAIIDLKKDYSEARALEDQEMIHAPKMQDALRIVNGLMEEAQVYDFKEKIYFILRKKESMFTGFDFHSHGPFKVVVTDEIIDVFDYGTDQTARYHAVYG